MFAILTASRMKAVRLATWGEIDVEKRIWEIPPEHDKIKDPKRDRTIYLSQQAIEVFEKVRPNLPRADELIFKADNGGSFSDAATTALIRRMHARQKALDVRQTPKMERLFSQTGTLVSGFSPWLNF